MSNTLDRRIAVLEQQAGAGKTNRLRLIFLLAMGEELRAVAASQYWPDMERAEDESESEFKERCLAVADAAMPPGHVGLMGQRSV